MKIDRWFQGPMVHGVEPEHWGTLVSEPGERGVRPECLGSAVTLNTWQDNTALERVDKIIDRLFPGRVCDCALPVYRVIHFNNSKETTREDVDKVLRIYTEEVEAAHESTR